AGSHSARQPGARCEATFGPFFRCRATSRHLDADGHVSPRALDAAFDSAPGTLAAAQQRGRTVSCGTPSCALKTTTSIMPRSHGSKLWIRSAPMAKIRLNKFAVEL